MGCKDANSSQVLRHANINPLDHRVLLSAIRLLPEEAGKVFIKGAMYPFQHDVQSQHIHGETRQGGVDKNGLTPLDVRRPHHGSDLDVT